MLNAIKKFFYRTDWVLLGLCLAASIFGIVMIASASNYHGASTYVSKQIIALVIGLILFVVLSFLDIEILAEHQTLLVIFSAVFLAMLYPFGVEGDTGNRSWMSIPGMPFMIQPAEYCKIIYIIVCARIMTIYQEHINSLPCVLRLGFVSAVFMGLIVVISKDAGSGLVYLFVFVCMAFAGGFALRWIFLGLGGAVGGFLAAWNFNLLRGDWYDRIKVILDHSYQPEGKGWQQTRGMLALGSGKLTGQGLFNGTQTQSLYRSSLPERQTDFIFCVCGEELGFIGCLLIIVLLLAIIVRCLIVAREAPSRMESLVCVGMAGMLIFQTIANIGMCLFLMPVIGLTLPFFSYGGSSIVTLFAAMGVVSGIKKRSRPEWLIN